MRTPRLAAIAALLASAAPATGQICAPIVPSGQPGLAAIAPICGPVLLPPPLVWAAGNPAFSIVIPGPPAIPPFSPLILLFGLEAPATLVAAPPLDPAFGAPGLVTAALPTALVFSAGVSGLGPTVLATPIPPTGGPVPAISMQAVFVTFSPVGPVALTAATEISI